jgi:site-specific recombinase XerD
MLKSTISIIEHIPRFLNYCQNEKKLSKKTYENYRHYLKKFILWLKENKKENTLPHELTNNDICEYKLFLSKSKHYRDKPLKKITQNYYLIALRALLGYFTVKDIVSIPADKITLPKGAKKENKIPILSSKQINKLLSAPNTKTKNGLRNRAILATLISSGLKISQLIKLDKNQNLYFSNKTLSYIKDYLNSRKDKEKALFISYGSKKRTVSRLTTRSIERIVKKYEKKISLPFPITPETLRWAYVRNLLREQEYNPKIIEKPIIHKNLLVENYNYTFNNGNKNKEKKRENPPAWHIIEPLINKEKDWLKNNISVLSDAYQTKPLALSNCYILRKLATLIVNGRVKAKEFLTSGKIDLWDGLTKKVGVNNISYHGKEWHKKMMTVTYEYFEKQNYKVTLEPVLNYGRADLGINIKSNKILYIEIGTVSLFKLWYNLSVMQNIAFLIVPSEDYAIELRTN